MMNAQQKRKGKKILKSALDVVARKAVEYPMASLGSCSSSSVSVTMQMQGHRSANDDNSSHIKYIFNV
jgi:hypothetical protein